MRVLAAKTRYKLARPFLTRAEPSIIAVDGLRLKVPSRFLPHYVLQPYEPLTRQFIRRKLRRGDTFLDVGAHLGYYAVAAARRVGGRGIVHAVEPTPENCEYILENCRLNRVSNVRLYACAAGRTRCKRTFNLTSSSDSNSFFEHPNIASSAQIQVDEVPIDELLSDPVNVIKIDVEGAEIEVLQGMHSLLTGQADAPSLCVEWNPACLRRAGQEPRALPALLRDLGYRKLWLIDDHNETIRTDIEGWLCGVHEPTQYVNLWAEREAR